MEQILKARITNPGTQEHEAKRMCQNCLSPDIEEGYNVDLCADCRKKLSKRSFPLWVIIFSLIILAATVFSLVRLPSVVSTAVAFSRGEKAAKEKNYITAANEYKKVQKNILILRRFWQNCFLPSITICRLTRPMTPLRLYRKGRRRYRTGRESK